MSSYENYWWKNQLRKYKSTTYIQPPMVLPKINSLTGHYIPEYPSIHDEMNYMYSLYSKRYWEGVKERQKAYLLRNNSK